MVKDFSTSKKRGETVSLFVTVCVCFSIVGNHNLNLNSLNIHIRKVELFAILWSRAKMVIHLLPPWASTGRGQDCTFFTPNCGVSSKPAAQTVLGLERECLEHLPRFMQVFHLSQLQVTTFSSGSEVARGMSSKKFKQFAAEAMKDRDQITRPLSTH